MSDSLIDVYSRHQHFIERYKTGQFNRLKPFLKRIESGLRAELLKTNTVFSQKRIAAKLAFVESLVLTELSAFTFDFNAQLEALMVSETNFGAKALEQFVEGFEATIPTLAQLTAAVNKRPFNTKLLRDALDEFSRGQAKAIRDTVSMGFFEGDTTPEIVNNVIGTKGAQFKDGALNVTRNSASRMVRTAVNHVTSVSKDVLYQRNIELVPYYEWVSTLDSRTSATCMSLDGEIFKTGKGKLPPAHYNCRSTTAPILKGEFTEKDGVITKKPSDNTRASIDGQVDADLNYNDFLERQSNAFQDEALGKAKGKLFRDGGLTVDKFVDRTDAPLSLEELENLYPLAWGKAGLPTS